MEVPCWAQKSAMPSSQLGKFVDDFSLHSNPHSTFQYWHPVEKEASLPVLTWFLHVQWPKRVLSSATGSYHQILVGKGSGNSQNCLGVVSRIPLNNNLKDHITQWPLGFLCGNLWLLEGALFYKGVNRNWGTLHQKLLGFARQYTSPRAFEKLEDCSRLKNCKN